MVNQTSDNPLVAVTLRFKDGAALRQVFTTPVPQWKAMKFLGQMVAELGGELKIELEPESDAKTRVAELITLFSRCRQSHDIRDGCGGGKSECTRCPYEKEHSELWEILDKERCLFMEGVMVVKPLLPDDVIRELYWDKLALPAKGGGKEKP